MAEDKKAENKSHDKEDIEGKMNRIIRRLYRHDIKLEQHTKAEENSVKNHDQDAEKKYDKREEKDVSLMLKDFIFLFRLADALIKDIEKVEEEEGLERVHEHFEVRDVNEIRNLHTLLGKMANIEKE